MKKLILITLIAMVVMAGCVSSAKNDTGKKVERIPFVEDLLSQMTLEEKVGQMAQVTLDVITKGPNQFSSDEPLELDMEIVRRAIKEYGVGSLS